MSTFFHRLVLLTSTLLASSLFVACTEEPLSIDLSGDTFAVKDTLLTNIDGFTYQVPPEMGIDKHLYLGEYNGFRNPFALLKMNIYSVENPNFTWTHLLDSTITIENIDSAYFTITYDDSVFDDQARFLLYYFPDGPDSVFSEKASNYNNIQLEDLQGEMKLIEEQTIQSDSASHFLRFSLMDDLSELLDTTGQEPNHVFLLTYDSTTTSELFPFKSSESITGRPQISVYYRRQLVADTTDTTTAPFDTTYHTFIPTADVSILIPPSVAPEDTTTCCTVSRGMGLKSVIFLPELDSLNLPTEATIHKAELSFFNSDTTPDYGFYLYPLVDSVNVAEFNLMEDYEVEPTLGSFAKVAGNGLVTMEIKGFIQRYHFQDVANLGLKLESTSQNDPFEIVHLNIAGSDSLYPKPRLVIQYVAP
jgi:hypothetical protein